MNLLTIKDNKVEINPETLLIKEFKDIWDADPKRKKEYSKRELAYIYFLCDYNSVYQSYPKDKRSDKIRLDLSNDGKSIKLSQYCQAGIDKYEELQNTASMGFLKSAQEALDAMTEYFKNVNFNERDNKGNPIYKATDVTRCLKDAGGVLESIEKLKEKVKTEIYEKNTSRGGSDINVFEI